MIQTTADDNFIQQLNALFSEIEAQLEDVVSRSGVAPSELSFDFDMNSYAQINCGTSDCPGLPPPGTTPLDLENPGNLSMGLGIVTFQMYVIGGVAPITYTITAQNLLSGTNAPTVSIDSTTGLVTVDDTPVTDSYILELTIKANDAFSDDSETFNISGVPLAVGSWNPLDIAAGIVLSNSNLTMANPALGSVRSGRATMTKTAGKWYWETSFDSIRALLRSIGVGVATPLFPITGAVGNDTSGPGRSYGVLDDGDIRYENVVIGTFGVAISAGNIVRHKLDLDAGTYAIALGSGAFITVSTTLLTISSSWLPAGSVFSDTDIITINVGGSSFTYPVPGGFTPIGS